MLKNRNAHLLTAALVGLAALAQAQTSLAPLPVGTWGFDLTGRKLRVKPGDDFFKWANGNSEARTQIPADRSSYGGTTMLVDLVDTQVRDILQEAATEPLTPNSEASKLAAAWRHAPGTRRAHRPW